MYFTPLENKKFEFMTNRHEFEINAESHYKKSLGYVTAPSLKEDHVNLVNRSCPDVSGTTESGIKNVNNCIRKQSNNHLDVSATAGSEEEYDNTDCKKQLHCQDASVTAVSDEDYEGAKKQVNNRRDVSVTADSDVDYEDSDSPIKQYNDRRDISIAALSDEENDVLESDKRYSSNNNKNESDSESGCNDSGKSTEDNSAEENENEVKSVLNAQQPMEQEWNECAVETKQAAAQLNYVHNHGKDCYIHLI